MVSNIFASSFPSWPLDLVPGLLTLEGGGDGCAMGNALGNLPCCPNDRSQDDKKKTQDLKKRLGGSAGVIRAVQRPQGGVSKKVKNIVEAIVQYWRRAWRKRPLPNRRHIEEWVRRHLGQFPDFDFFALRTAAVALRADGDSR